MRLREAIERSSVSDWLLVLFTAVLAAVAIYQYFAMGDQLGAMKDSNRISREALESVQRAFVNFHHIAISRANVHTPSGDVRELDVKATWENSGATPALYVVRLLGADKFKDEPTEEQFIPKNATPDANITVIAPKAEADAGTVVWNENAIFGDALTHPTSENLRRSVEGEHLFVWGWVTYRDVFVETKLHLTEFCEGLHRVVIPDNRSNQPTFEFLGCHRHNCTDEQCEDYGEVLNLAATVKP